MKKIIFIFLIPFICLSQKYKAVETSTDFFSWAPLENITAVSNDLEGIVDVNNGEFFFRLPIKSFTFKRSLMQKHFNDKYLNSDDYPFATFKGKSYNLKEELTRVIDKAKANNILNQEESIITKQLSELFDQGILVEGKLMIHGEEKDIKIKIVLSLEKKLIKFYTMFFVKTDDYKIKIPKLLKDNISEKIEVKVSGYLDLLD